MGELRIEMQGGFRPQPAPAATSAQSDEYVASRDSGDPNSLAALQVEAMNKEMNAWTRTNAPDVFREDV